MAGDKNEWTVLEILTLENFSLDDRLWIVLNGELIPNEILHEFACLCAESALALIENPDKRSINAIAAKRAWVRREITSNELAKARVDAMEAAKYTTDDVLKYATESAVYAAESGARVASMAASMFALMTASLTAVWSAGWSYVTACALESATRAAKEQQVFMLQKLLTEKTSV